MIKPTILDHLHINTTDLFEGYQGHEIERVELARDEEKVATAKRLLKIGRSSSDIAQEVDMDRDTILKLCKGSSGR